MANGTAAALDGSLTSGFFTTPLAQADPELFRTVEAELGREQSQIELIASENIVSRAVLEAQGSVLTNKYAEGYPGKRYYGGCEYRRRRRGAGDRARQAAVRLRASPTSSRIPAPRPTGR